MWCNFLWQLHNGWLVSGFIKKNNFFFFETSENRDRVFSLNLTLNTKGKHIIYTQIIPYIYINNSFIEYEVILQGKIGVLTLIPKYVKRVRTGRILI